MFVCTGLIMYCLCQHCVMGPQKAVWANIGCILGYSNLGTANKYSGYRPR